MQPSGNRRNFDDDFLEFADERRRRSRTTTSTRRKIPIQYDSDVEIENDDFFRPKEKREVYRVYEDRSRKPAQHGGKRISIISIVSDDDAEAARLRHIQNTGKEKSQNQQAYEEAVDGGYGPTTIRIGEAKPHSTENENHVTDTNKLKSTSGSEPTAVTPDPELPPLVTKNEIMQEKISGDNCFQTESATRHSQNDVLSNTNHLAVPPLDFHNEVNEEVIIPQDKTDVKKSGSIRSLREVIASQKGKTSPAGRKDRAKLALSPSDPIFDNILNVPEPAVSRTSGTSRAFDTKENFQQDILAYSKAVIPPAPPPPPLTPSASTSNGHARSKTTPITTKTVYSKPSTDRADTSRVVMRKKEKKNEEFGGSQKSLGTSKLSAQQEREFPNEQIESSIHDSLRDLDLYLKQQKDGDNVSISSHASSKQLEQFHFALSDESTPM